MALWHCSTLPHRYKLWAGRSVTCNSTHSFPVWGVDAQGTNANPPPFDTSLSHSLFLSLALLSLVTLAIVKGISGFPIFTPRPCHLSFLSLHLQFIRLPWWSSKLPIYCPPWVPFSPELDSASPPWDIHERECRFVIWIKPFRCTVRNQQRQCKHPISHCGYVGSFSNGKNLLTQSRHLRQVASCTWCRVGFV